MLTSIETLRPRVQPNLLFVVLHDEDGSTGLGEAFFGSRAVEAYLHESVAEVLLREPDPAPERVAQRLRPYTGFQGAGAEVRGNAAVDLALWDLLGKRAGLPLARLLGGPVREALPIYNTCAGPGYVSRSTRQESGNWGVPAAGGTGRYEDLEAFLTRPARLARELWDEGIRGMKIWPFDRAAEATGGTRIGHADLADGLRILDAVREEVGEEMDVMVELHGLWQRGAAAAILRALRPYRPVWVEDPVRPDAVDALVALKAETDVPIATGETLVGRRGFLPLLAAGAMDVATVDLQWTGGLTEARKVASLADAYAVPIAPHDCTGPVTLATCVHLGLSQPNGMVQETARSFLRTWYTDLVDGLPRIDRGSVVGSAAPGHGVTLHDDLRDRDLVERTVTRR